jgi:hypothetical protein
MIPLFNMFDAWKCIYLTYIVVLYLQHGIEDKTLWFSNKQKYYDGKKCSKIPHINYNRQLGFKS